MVLRYEALVLELGKQAATVSRNWVVRCNPTEFLLDEYLDAGNDVTDITDWFVSYRFADIQTGDRIAFWVSGATSGGGCAFGFVTNDVYEDFGDRTYWNRPGVTAQLQHFVPFQLVIGTIDQPIRWASLKADPVLKNSHCSSGETEEILRS